MSDLQIQLHRTTGLLRKYHLDWEVNCLGVDEPTGIGVRDAIFRGEVKAPRLDVSPLPGAGVVRLTLAIGLDRLAKETCGLGRPDPDVPLTFWPIHVAVSAGFRLRNLDWPVEFHWPSTLLLHGDSVAVFHLQRMGKCLLLDAAFSLEQRREACREDSLVVPFRTSLATFPLPDPAIPPNAVLPTLLHGIMACFQSPWPRDLALRFYSRHCVQLRGGRETFHLNDALVKGIARGISDDGFILLEDDGGRELRVPCEIPILGRPSGPGSTT